MSEHEKNYPNPENGNNNELRARLEQNNSMIAETRAEIVRLESELSSEEDPEEKNQLRSDLIAAQRTLETLEHDKQILEQELNE